MIRNWLPVWILAMAGAMQAAPIYTVQDLGTLGGTTATAYAINGAGMAVGVSSDMGGYRYAFSNFGIGFEVLSSNGADASAAGVNNGGAVAGTVYANGHAQATVWRNGAATSVGSAGTYGMGINDAGQVTGSANGRAFLYSDGTMTDLGTLPGGSWSAGYSVNSSGQVAGYGSGANGSFQAFLWSQATGLAAIPGLGGTNSYAMAVNDAGGVTGSAQIQSGYAHAFVSKNGQTTDLGTLGGNSSRGYGINSAGDIVGYSLISSNMATHAFLSQDGVMWDLNNLISTAGWVLTEAYAINGSGQIVGTGSLNGIQHAFRLDLAAVAPFSPAMRIQGGVIALDSAPAGVPEPSTTGMMLLSLSTLLVFRTKRFLWNRATGKHS